MHSSKTQSSSAFPIDIVYLWCDGNDPSLMEKRIRHLDETQRKAALTKSATAKGRFQNNDELKYAFRSLEKFAPFIRNIFLVTDNQHPEWLNLSHPKLHLIDHQSIIPAKYLPTFNSSVIEAFIHKIPNLSEHFLLANDDFLFGAKTSPELFFDKAGNPYVYGRPCKYMQNLPQLREKGLALLKGKHFQHNYYYTNLQLFYKYGKSFPLITHHNIDAYRKSSINESVKVFHEDYEKLYPCRFRTLGTINRFLPLFHDYVNDRATLKTVQKLSKTKLALLPKSISFNFFKFHSIEMSMDALYNKGPRFSQILKEKIKKGHFKLICFNDTEYVEDHHREYFKVFISDLFPEKSSFEI